MVNGLRPMEWRWGHDAICVWLNSKEYAGEFKIIKNLPFTVFQGLMVYPMDDLNQTGVACIGKKPYVSLLEKSE